MSSIDVVNIRLVKDRKLLSTKKIDCPESAIEILGQELREYDREVVAVINLQSDGKPININIVSMGTLNAAITDPAQIFKSAILSNAASIIMMHNHPSGNITPSKEDIDLTHRIYTCGEIMGIKLLDHIIVGSEFFSFASHNMLQPDQQLNINETNILKKMLKSHTTENTEELQINEPSVEY